MLTEIRVTIERKDNIRAHLEAMQNRLENTITNLNIQAENLQASESRISDTDVATEMTEFTRITKRHCHARAIKLPATDGDATDRWLKTHSPPPTPCGVLENAAS